MLRTALLLAVLILAGCGEAMTGAGEGGDGSKAGPSIEEWTDCGELRAFYLDAGSDLKYADDNQDRFVAKFVQRRVVRRMNDLDCENVPKAPQ